MKSILALLLAAILEAAIAGLLVWRMRAVWRKIRGRIARD